MLRVYGTINGRQTLLLGLDRGNTTAMHQDQPVVVDVEALLATQPDARVQDLVIFAEETLADCHRRVQSIFGPDAFPDVDPAEWDKPIPNVSTSNRPDVPRPPTRGATGAEG